MKFSPDKIIVHCTDTPDGKWITVKDIDRWHLKKGWFGCGYHYVIRRDAKIEVGRKLDKTGAHCMGQNSSSIGICLVGRNTFTSKQMESLESICLLLYNELGIKPSEIYGHYEFSKTKTCPNLPMEWIRHIMTKAWEV